MANVGEALTAPEAGWRRYDDKWSALVYSGSWTNTVSATSWNGAAQYANADVNAKVTFKFYGTKIRVMGFGTAQANYNAAVKITIDGVSETFTSKAASEIPQMIQYQKLDLAEGVHTVEISSNGSTTFWYMDSIDIDSKGLIVVAPPATTGKLRQRIEEMEVGDFVAMNCKSGVYAWGDGAVPELPLLGVASNYPTSHQYYWYVIKADKGLLISDRIWLHTTSWDTLNASKLIQGATFFIGDKVSPVFAGDNPARIKTNYAQSKSVWLAFDNNAGTNFDINPTGGNDWSTSWFSVDLLAPTAFNRFEVDSVSGQAQYSTVYFELHGSNDDTTYTKIGTYNNADDSKTLHVLDFSQVTYRYIKVTGYKCGSASYAWAGEMRLMSGVSGLLRSLTGGVAYADTNGNLSMKQLNLSFGAFPTNNEYDTYINRSNLMGKVTPNDDDVWHHKKTATFAQDTVVNGSLTNIGGDSSSIASSTQRALRGNDLRTDNSWKGFSFNTTSGTWSFVGFRPVFEYKEV